MAYGHAIRSAKGRKKFGHGDIRGIAASEGANNATIISDLVPTLLFSVPGGPAAAIFLGALFTFGYYPGPRMITQHPDLMFLIVWSVALASVVGAGLCFAVTPLLARLTRIPFAIIAAPLVLVMVIGAYQSTSTMGDIFMLFALGAVGWLMKHAGWPRAPALVGFVLASPMEQYFWLTNQLHGWSWLARPGVLLIASVIVVPLVWQRLRARRKAPVAAADSVPADSVAADTVPAEVGVRVHPGTAVLLALLVTTAFCYALFEMRTFNPSSRLMPLLAALPGLPLAAWLLFRSLREYAPDDGPALGETPVMLALIGYALGVWAVGWIVPTGLLLAWILLARARMRWWTAAIYGGLIFVVIGQLFELLRGDAPAGALLRLG